MISKIEENAEWERFMWNNWTYKFWEENDWGEREREMNSKFYAIYFWVVWRVVVVVAAGNVNSSSSIFSKQHCQRQVVAINSHNHSTLHYIEIWTTGPRAKIFCSSHYINTCKNSWVDRGAARYILHSS